MKWITDKSITETEWFYLKLSFVLVSLPVMCIMAFEGFGCPFPTGICKFYNFEPLFSSLGKYLLVFAYVLLCIFYILEKKMLATTFFLFFISCIIISHHESNGIFFRATILTTIWGSQFFAYFIFFLNSDFNIKHFRFHYVVQIIAATYTLAGISKLKESGIEWVNAGPFFSIQILKNYSYLYFDTGSELFLQQGKEIAYFMINHPLIIKFLLFVSLILEFFCFAATFGNKMRMTFGIGLLLMHIGIMCIFGIGISIIAKPMVVFFINPLYRLRQATAYIYSKITIAL